MENGLSGKSGHPLVFGEAPFLRGRCVKVLDMGWLEFLKKDGPETGNQDRGVPRCKNTGARGGKGLAGTESGRWPAGRKAFEEALNQGFAQ